MGHGYELMGGLQESERRRKWGGWTSQGGLLEAVFFKIIV